MTATDICRDPGCDEPVGPHGARGLCSKHYQQERQRSAAPCVIDGCDEPVYNKSTGYCTMHYQRWRRTGDSGSATSARRDWKPILARAAAIVESYDIPVTLRQLYYRLVSEQLIRNGRNDAAYLSEQTAKLRRAGAFPPLYEHGRRLREYLRWDSPEDALKNAADIYRRDRTEGQDYDIFLAVEKNALGDLLLDWFGDLGIPVLPLGGYGSETLERAVRERAEADPRPAVLIYAGDFDASGLNIGRTFVRYTADLWYRTVRIGLGEAHVWDGQRELLPINPGTTDDPRAPAFVEEFPGIHEWAAERGIIARRSGGKRVPVQVELDAVEPRQLRQMYLDALAPYWDEDAYQDVLDREAEERERLEELAEAA
jgi:hypothetical protein